VIGLKCEDNSKAGVQKEGTNNWKAKSAPERCMLRGIHKFEVFLMTGVARRQNPCKLFSG